MGRHLAVCAVRGFTFSRGGAFCAVGFRRVETYVMEKARDGNNATISGAFAGSGSRGVAEILGGRGPAGVTEGEAGFTTTERLALAAGDSVSSEFFEQQLVESGIGPPHCPHCGFEKKRIEQWEHTVQTRRGLEVPLNEHQCYCPGCRRAFFSRTKTLGLDVDDDDSPTALKKVVYARTQARCFPQGSRDCKCLPNWRFLPNACVQMDDSDAN